jgi:hypothetical protein
MNIPELSITDIVDEHKIEVEITNKTKDRENKKHLSPSNQVRTPEMSSSADATPVNQIISISNPSKTVSVPLPSPPSKECGICIELYNRSTRVRVTCQSCGYEACRQCCATFILDASNTLPNCMNCHKEFQREFLVENFTQKFVSKDWKDHRERVIFQKERALLPTRQPVAEMMKRKNHLSAECNEILEQISALRTRH